MNNPRRFTMLVLNGEITVVLETHGISITADSGERCAYVSLDNEQTKRLAAYLQGAALTASEH